ncbi:MAG: putative hydrolase or acyltransferase [Microbacterium sp.]|jgi:pimeloyl-ACP methyl ester carboxylesterase|nr:putative hydrolase or acyltransferase [Microbacterium sp.]
MKVVLVPGLWLTASSWDAVVPALLAAGHRPEPLSMPGIGISADGSAQVGIADWIAEVVRVIDRDDEPVVLVGHSGGANVVWGAADARPDRVARVVFVDAVPPLDGAGIWEFPIVDGVVPFPGWDSFDEEEVADLDAPTRQRVEEQVTWIPARIPTDPISLSDDRRHGIPITVITCLMPSVDVRRTIDAGAPWVAELAAADEVEIIDLPGGHWPQFAQPEALGKALVASIRSEPVAEN